MAIFHTTTPKTITENAIRSGAMWKRCFLFFWEASAITTAPSQLCTGENDTKTDANLLENGAKQFRLNGLVWIGPRIINPVDKTKLSCNTSTHAAKHFLQRFTSFTRQSDVTTDMLKWRLWTQIAHTHWRTVILPQSWPLTGRSTLDERRN